MKIFPEMDTPLDRVLWWFFLYRMLWFRLSPVDGNAYMGWGAAWSLAWYTR